MSLAVQAAARVACQHSSLIAVLLFWGVAQSFNKF